MSEGFLFCYFIRIFWSWNKLWFTCSVFCVSSLSTPLFIECFNCVSFIYFGCIYCFIGGLWFLCFFYCDYFSFCWNRRSDDFLPHILFWFTLFFNHVSILFFENRVIISDKCMFAIIEIPTFFLPFSLGVSHYLGKR